MPRTVEKTVYQFAELSDEAKERARDWYRSASIGDNFFAESVIEDAETIAQKMGFTLRRRTPGKPTSEPCIYWQGFWSQGDGACFEGSWSAENVEPGEVMTHAPQDQELHHLANIFETVAAQFPEASFTIRQSGHYSHSGCTRFEFNFPELDDDTEQHDEAMTALAGASRMSESDAEDALLQASREFMDWIYSQLEKEYNWTNADEQVDETIEGNGYEFTAEGNIY